MVETRQRRTCPQRFCFYWTRFIKSRVFWDAASSLDIMKENENPLLFLICEEPVLPWNPDSAPRVIAGHGQIISQPFPPLPSPGLCGLIGLRFCRRTRSRSCVCWESCECLGFWCWYSSQSWPSLTLRLCLRRDLSRNRIQELPAGIFRGLQALQILWVEPLQIRNYKLEVIQDSRQVYC